MGTVPSESPSAWTVPILRGPTPSASSHNSAVPSESPSALVRSKLCETGWMSRSAHLFTTHLGHETGQEARPPMYDLLFSWWTKTVNGQDSQDAHDETRAAVLVNPVNPVHSSRKESEEAALKPLNLLPTAGRGCTAPIPCAGPVWPRAVRPRISRTPALRSARACGSRASCCLGSLGPTSRS